MKTTSKFVLIVTLALFSLLATERASAQTATGFLTQTGTGLTSFSIAQGGTFSLSLNITTNFGSVGISYWYQVSGNGTGLFSLVSRTTAGSPFNDNTVLDSVAFSPGNAVLDPVSGGSPEPADLGATGPVTAPGNIFISSFTFSSTAPAGVYMIFLDSRGIVATSDFADVTLNANAITVTVVPEPATTGLAVLGGVMLLGFVWKARRAMA